MLAKISSTVLRFTTKQAHSFGREAGLILATRLLQNANGFLLAIIVVREFGLSSVGLLTISLAGVVVLATLLTFGLHYVVAKSELPLPQRNSIGLAVSAIGVVCSLPLCAGLGAAFGHNWNEAAIIAVLALAGPFFAQTLIANSLLVLQARISILVLSPLSNLIGLGLGLLAASDFLTFSIILTACRFFGVLTIFLLLPMERISLGALRIHIRQGISYVTADTIGLAAEQTSVFIASLMLTRADLGVFGLIRQILSVGDSPAWSRLMAWYPSVCLEPSRVFPGIRKQMLMMGLACSIVLSIGSVPLGLWIYELPSFAWLTPIMMSSVPFRFVVFTYEMSLRAVGAISAINALAALRCVLVVFLPFGILLAGITGAVVASVVQATALALAAKLSFDKSLGLGPAVKKLP